MIFIKNTQKRFSIKEDLLRKKVAAMIKRAGYPHFDVGIWFTTNATIRKFNKRYRSKDKPTDILSFPYHHDLKPGKTIFVQNDDDKNLGDIIISVEFADQDAPKTWQRTLDEHLVFLLAHGIAHLCGYDHATDKEAMLMSAFEKKLTF